MDQQFTLSVPIDILSDISKETFQKVVFRSITDEFSYDFDINNGLVLKDSTLTQFNQAMLKDINCTYQQDELLSLIYPTKINNQSLLMVVNISNDGIYEKINNQKELFRGEHYQIGLPAGSNKQTIEIKEDQIIINSQSFAIKEMLQIVFVKKISDNKYEYIQMANPSDCSSRKHAHIKIQNGRIFLLDGFEKQVSKNGVWVLIKHQRFSNQNQYCFKDFRVAIRLKY
ncbi:unnamed protein product (macronuclear) [Paramecium tetraurelia]|uniref:FHA domain-containing protein n=1 Tax=Paramecium tetraurelia TaxID=5888 RepID=A0CZI3_PARTE|nr:uncharacterized protein GSPATT00011773001 [Paramecium tetraurelia]CAK76200.1 unnamed protein product [Paramecium tetraurelia]|eukprot:XP_001443597.1 hypothetical protein (macronuclear) [Paramecium tetraurelia strain d4-2]